MPTFCAANRCTNNSNKGYSVFNFPSNEVLRQKWIAALGKGSDWRPTFQRICEVHFNSVDIQLVAGRKQLCENAIPCHFCVCPYDKETNKKNKLRKKSTKPFETADHAYCSEKKSLPLQLRSSNNTLPHTYISEHNYFAHTGKENKEYFIKEVFNDAKKKLGLVNSERNRHVDHCPLLRSPISIDQLWTESNMDINQNESSLDMNHNELDINSRQALISNIDTLSKDNENLKLKLNEIRMTQTRKINDQDAKLKEVTADNKALKKQLEKLNQQIIRINSSVDKLTSRPSQYSDKSIIKGLSLWTACGTSGYNRVRKAFDVELPAPRTLQRKIQNISFNPGILEDIFLCLESRINNMEERSKLCCLVFDEMSIEPKIEYDRGSDSNMGYCTLPALPIAASKALLFLIAGVYKRYKQVLAYHFTSTSTDSATVKDFILSLLEKCETSGLHVLVLVCDMGNRGILNQLGFSCRKNDIQYSIQHPFNKKEKLFALPDVVHVFKNLKEMLMKIGIITLPD
ncbi:uncharacterized protein LOC143898232 [Temnothorax americanus]|uniref:uncharacterized protein LOC143898232 n=1 Tax=Temnothorax americanus TaxID=1964332 RepID=UPI0040678823